MFNFKILEIMNLEKLNLVELDALEGENTQGGSTPSWFRKTVWGYALTLVIDNWSDIKSGASDGWNDAA